MKCYECEGKIERKKVPFSMHGIKLGNFEAEVCSKCGEIVFDEKVSDQIDKVAKEKGIWGLERKSKVIMSGNSMAIRIPKTIVDFLKIKQGEEVFMHPEEHKLVVEMKH